MRINKSLYFAILISCCSLPPSYRPPPNQMKEEECMSKVLDLCLERDYNESQCKFYADYVCSTSNNK